MDPILSLILSLFLSYIFVVASLHKWKSLKEFHETLENYQVLPSTVIPFFTYLIPLLEGIAGIGLLVPVTGNYAVFTVLILLMIYMVGITLNLIRGRRSIDCGCGGADQKQSISEWLVFRNMILSAFALLLFLDVEVRELVWLDWSVVALATVSVCLIYNTINQLFMNNELLQVLRKGHG